VALTLGVERAVSRETCVEAGAMTMALSAGAAEVRSRDRAGAGAMMLLVNAGMVSRRSDCMLGAGATMAEFRFGVLRNVAAETLGDGGITESRVAALRD
jgi:hypothetical protein